MSDVALKSISILIGSFFILFGLLKLVPLFSVDLYHELRGMFERSSKVFPLQRWTGWRPDAGAMRRCFGAAEVVAGAVLAVGGAGAADVANIALILLLLFALYANWALSEGLREASHAIVLGIVLTCRFVIRLQTLHRNEEVEDGLDNEEVDQAFRQELRSRIAALRETVWETQQLLKENQRPENGTETRKLKQRKGENQNRKGNPTKANQDSKKVN